VITESELFHYVSKSYPYEQKNISVIDTLGRQIFVDDFYQLMKIREFPYTLKIESMEKYSETLYKYGIRLAKSHNHFGPVTCHLFWARKGDCSFPEHVDLDDVVIYCAQGTKHMKIEGKDVFVHEGEEVLIKRGTKHQAMNTSDSIMLSFGLERFSVEKAI
jgi:mannose-6-phosphate isomerase-like protein (cupin superfamily)